VPAPTSRPARPASSAARAAQHAPIPCVTKGGRPATAGRPLCVPAPSPMRTPCSRRS
jgi:hypothetical protein